MANFALGFYKYDVMDYISDSTVTQTAYLEDVVEQIMDRITHLTVCQNPHDRTTNPPHEPDRSAEQPPHQR
jgi:hypothetical protein